MKQTFFEILNWIKLVTAGFIGKIVPAVQEIVIDVLNEFKSQKYKIVLLYFFLSWHTINRAIGTFHDEHALAAVLAVIIGSWAYVIKWFVTYSGSGDSV